MGIKTIDYAIIGAGAAGTYSAWRLANDENIDASQVAVFDFQTFEGKAHIGGRLWSPHLAGLGNVRKAELGGMRYLTSQTVVSSLIKELELDTVPFVVESNDILYYFRNKILRADEITDPKKLPYAVGKMEQGLTAGELISYAIESIVPNAPYLKDNEWLEIKKNFKVEGRHLYEWGFWNLLQRVLTQEACSYAKEGQGYDTIPSNWNAGDAMEWFFSDFNASVSYMYVKDGYQTIPETLLQQACDKGVELHHPYQLQKWEQGEEGKIILTFLHEGKKERIHCKQLILAMPRRSLELIEMPANPKLAKLIPAVKPQAMFKFFACYDFPWWRTFGIASGRTITDLPLRQIYYWGSNYKKFFDHAPEKTRGVKNRNDNSMIMSYLDGRDVSFWQPLFESVKKGERERLSLKCESAEMHNETSVEFNSKIQPRAFAIWDNLDTQDPAVAAVVEFIQDQLRQTHGVNYIPMPYSLAYADWTTDPFGGAYNLWNPGYKSWEVTNQIRKPYEHLPVYICGEAYSVKQGWVEGALETAEQVMQSNLKLQKPSWLPDDWLPKE